MQALGVAAAFHNAAGELVDDLDLAVGDHVLLVAVEHVLGLQRLLQVVDQLTGEIGIDVIDTQAALNLLKAALGGGDSVLGLVHDVVARGSTSSVAVSMSCDTSSPRSRPRTARAKSL